MVMTYSSVEDRGQRSVGSEGVETNKRTDRQTDGRTDGGDCITYRINAVGKYTYNYRAKALIAAYSHIKYRSL